MRLSIILLFFLSCFPFYGQTFAPTMLPLVIGTGTYAGLKKIPRNCATPAREYNVMPSGDFYVSNVDDSGLRTFSTVSSAQPSTGNLNDGLTYTKTWMNYFYGLSISGSMPPSITNSGILNPNSAPAVCFRKNYNSSGVLIGGTTVNNMWYLPALMEMSLIYLYETQDAVATFGTSSLIAGNYWTASNAVSGYVYQFNMVNGDHFSSNTNSSQAYVRCCRR